MSIPTTYEAWIDALNQMHLDNFLGAEVRRVGKVCGS
ncbi:hypothetical protein SAMN05443245_0942 [Paraburkholderia fungorum]|uniref:Uncharacterized protein n=1 Tax=Paraburkholderia fungorum TaxID=134537 RepID=A0A1H1A010_9BURK|nr:hypothetical protein SAMN05443245_0942 [Paraburkholderia fungorum]